MKNTRVTARRMFQGGAAFAALGALSIAAALPAGADVEYYGWAYGSVGNGQGVSASYDGTSSNSYSGSVGDWLTFSGTSSSTVTDDGVSATATVDTARVQITVADIEEIVEKNLTEGETDGDGDGDGETDGDGEAGDDEILESDEAGDETDGGDTDGGDTDGGDTDGGDTEGSEEPTEPEAPQSPEAPEPTPSAESEPLLLDEETTELSSGSDGIVLDATLSGVTTTTTQSWGGEVSHSADVAEVSYPDTVTLDSGEQVTIWVDIQSYEGVDELYDDEYGIDWNDAYTGFAVTFTVDGADAPFHYVDLAESVASVGTAKVGGGDGDGDGGDDKPAPTHPDDETEQKPDPKKLEGAESLATTGGPVAGLIAAGAAIAAGGGAAAYFARRKGNTADSVTEDDEG